MELEHGGQLKKIIEQYQLGSDGWLDLSTGISPWSYPIPILPENIWRELPHPTESFLNVAKQYFSSENLIVNSGSQAVIQKLPELWLCFNEQKVPVYVPREGYKEHEKSWRDTQFEIFYYDDVNEILSINYCIIAVVINPNNPTGKSFEHSQLQRLSEQMNRYSGWLIVDEAFLEVSEQPFSMIQQANQAGVIVLRSLGKFFGLAGVRVGFTFAEKALLQRLQSLLGPWQVNGPALYIAEKALSDSKWQQQQLLRLLSHKHDLVSLLNKYFAGAISGSTGLFVSVQLANAEKVFELLCLQKVYVRLWDNKRALRFGIPSEKGLRQLAEALEKINLGLALSSKCLEKWGE